MSSILRELGHVKNRLRCAGVLHIVWCLGRMWGLSGYLILFDFVDAGVRR